MPDPEDDPFDSLFKLEETFYDEGHRLGVEDGRRAGLVEGRLFGFEKGFEKYAAMGRLHGKAVIWASRLPKPENTDVDEDGYSHNLNPSKDKESSVTLKNLGQQANQSSTNPSAISMSLPPLPNHSRLEKHIHTLYALAETSSLSIENNEDAVSDFDDRYRRAEGKAKIIEKLLGEGAGLNDNHPSDTHDLQRTGHQDSQKTNGDGSIEDFQGLRVRR